MNGEFVKSVAFDALVFWPMIYVAVSNYGGFGIYAELLISSIGVFMLILGVLLILMHESIAESSQNVDKYKLTKPHLVYIVISSSVGISLVFVLGWFWVASGFIAMTIGVVMIQAETDILEAM